VKGGAALEQLANGETLLFDTTGTITAGNPRVADILTAIGMTADDVLRNAASLDQVAPRPRRRRRARRTRPRSRPDAARTIRQLRRDGIHRIVMVTGDRRRRPDRGRCHQRR